MAAHQQPQRGAAHAAVQVETVRGPERPQPAGEVADRLVRLQAHHVVDVRVVRDEGDHGLLRDVDDPRLGVPAPQRAGEGRGEQDVADGAEAHEQDAQHAANSSLAY